MAFPQAVLETKVYIEILYSFKRVINRQKYILKHLHFIHGLKQSDYNFYKKLCKALKDRYIFLSPIDNYIFILNNLILIVYIDNILILVVKDVNRSIY